MNEIDQKELAALDICSHWFPKAIVMPHKDTFVLGCWCVRCGEASFTLFDDQEPATVTPKEEA